MEKTAGRAGAKRFVRAGVSGPNARFGTGSNLRRLGRVPIGLPSRAERAQCVVASSSGPTSLRSAGSSLRCVSNSANTRSHAPENIVNGRYHRKSACPHSPLFGQDSHSWPPPLTAPARDGSGRPHIPPLPPKTYTTKQPPWLRNCHNLAQCQHRYWAKSCCSAAKIGDFQIIAAEYFPLPGICSSRR